MKFFKSSLIPFLLLVLIPGCEIISTGNHDPYPLVAPETIDATSGESLQTFHLASAENPDGAYLYDEDGDTVTVVLDSETPLPDSITLNEFTGVLTVIRSSNVQGTLNFWTEDGKGGTTEDTPLILAYIITSSGNTPPTASFATWDYEISGTDAVTAGVNGNYTNTVSTSQSRPVYGSSGNSLFKGLDTSNGYLWAIDNSVVASSFSESGTANLLFFMYSNDDYPGSSPYKFGGTSTDSNVVVTAVPFDGDQKNIGSTLTIHYDFSDPDGDVEGLTLYQWLRETSASSGVYADVPGQTALTYTTSASDDGLRLKCRVTPVDEYGLVGSSVLSKASRVIGSSS